MSVVIRLCAQSSLSFILGKFGTGSWWPETDLIPCFLCATLCEDVVASRPWTLTKSSSAPEAFSGTASHLVSLITGQDNEACFLLPARNEPFITDLSWLQGGPQSTLRPQTLRACSNPSIPLTLFLIRSSLRHGLLLRTLLHLSCCASHCCHQQHQILVRRRGPLEQHG
jgi:hypothetical protein